MVDSFGTSQLGAASPEPEAPPKTGLAGFMATTAGKLVVGGVALVLVLVALGAIVFFYMFNAPEPDSAIIVPGSTDSTASAEATIAVRPAPTLQDTFAFRNIFEPTVKPRVVTNSGSGSSTDGTSTGGLDPSTVPDNTLVLTSISTVDGVPVASFIWNGATYTVGAGEQLEGTPWKVVSIEGNTVELLYGDAAVSLTLGQGVTK